MYISAFQCVYFLMIFLSTLQVLATMKYFTMEFMGMESRSKHKLETFIEMAFVGTQGVIKLYFMYFLTFKWEDAVQFLNSEFIMSKNEAPISDINKVSLNRHECQFLFKTQTILTA